jgi:hypothetical protein
MVQLAIAMKADLLDGEAVWDRIRTAGGVAQVTRLRALDIVAWRLGARAAADQSPDVWIEAEAESSLGEGEEVQF